MGTFRYSIEIAASPEGPFKLVRALVDTGAAYTWIPAAILQRLNVRAIRKQTFQMADGTIVERDIAEAVARIDGEMRHTIVVFGDGEPLLGAYTLEGFSLGDDPAPDATLSGYPDPV